MADIRFTKLYLLNVPLENDYKNTLYFSSEVAQHSYFLENVKRNYNDVSYQRKDGTIRVPAYIDNLYNCNYVMYQNSAYSDKWFYAFITNMEYVSDTVTNIFIETDVMQTWLFDYIVKDSFIEREHVSRDIAGLNTIDESLATGDYICNKRTPSLYGSSLEIIMGVTKTTGGDNVAGFRYNNIYSGMKYYGYPNTSAGINSLNSDINSYAGMGASDSIQCLFLAPTRLITQTSGNKEVLGSEEPDIEYINNPSIVNEVNRTLSITTGAIDGYTPRNKKLLCYPYRYLLVSNNCGASAILHFEQFYTGSGNNKTVVTPRFRIIGCLTPGCSVRITPCDYKGMSENDAEGLNLGKYPSLNWTSDMYTNWLTQNAVNYPVSIASGVLQMVGGGAMMLTGAGALAGAGSIASGGLSIAQTMGEKYKASLVPPQLEGNINSGDVLTAMQENDFFFYDMSVKREYAEILDSYFDMYGYQVNKVAIPNKNHRAAYWYTKCIDVNIDGAIPGKDMQSIKDCYNRGITFWRNAQNINNYSIANGSV